MKRIIVIIATTLMALPAVGQFDTSSWDISTIFGTDGESTEIWVFMADPVTEDIGVRVWRAMQGYVGILVEEAIMTKDGDCYTGNRTVYEGRSRMLYRKTPCNTYNEYREKWATEVARMFQPKPLEAIDTKK